MNAKHLSITTLATSLLITTGAASASLQLHAELHGQYTPDGEATHNVFRLYSQGAEAHRIAAWGNPIPSKNFFLTNTNADHSGNGTGFWGFVFAVILPQQAGGAYDAAPEQFDNSSFLTIGIEPGDPYPNVFQLIPGTNPDLHGVAKYSADGGVVTFPNQENAASIQFGDGDHRVLLGQFTVAAGENVSGENIMLSWQNADGVPQDEIFGLAFKVFPAPGALGLLGVAGLVGTRRRRA